MCGFICRCEHILYISSSLYLLDQSSHNKHDDSRFEDRCTQSQSECFWTACNIWNESLIVFWKCDLLLVLHSVFGLTLLQCKYCWQFWQCNFFLYILLDFYPISPCDKSAHTHLLKELIKYSQILFDYIYPEVLVNSYAVTFWKINDGFVSSFIKQGF